MKSDQTGTVDRKPGSGKSARRGLLRTLIQLRSWCKARKYTGQTLTKRLVRLHRDWNFQHLSAHDRETGLKNAML